MAVFNTTYNYNQGNMNFGQSLLYGAFGSLTGGMGGCMGMNGSIFSMMGMGGYGCGFGGYGYGDQMVGMQIGNMISGVLFGCITRAIEGRGGNGGSENTIKSDSELRSEAEKYVDENEPSLKTDVDTAKSNLDKVKEYATTISNAQSKITLIKSDISKYKEELDGYEQQKTNLKTKDIPANATQEIRQQIEEENKRIEEQIQILDKKIANVKKLKTESEKSLDEQNQAIRNARLELATFNLGVDLTNLENINTSALIEAAAKKVDEAEDARENKITEKFNKLKNEQDSTITSASGSKQISKAQKQADKEEAKLEKAKAEKAEKEAKEKEKAIKERRELFNNKLDAYKKSKSQAALNDVRKVITETEDVALKTAFQKTLNSILDKQKLGLT